MIDFIKKGMLAGLGAAAVTKESIEQTLAELVEKGKITQAEAQETAEKMFQQGKHEMDKAKGDFAKGFEEFLAKAQLTPIAEFRRLEARVAALEASLAAHAATPQAHHAAGLNPGGTATGIPSMPH